MRLAARAVLAVALVLLLGACQGAGWGYNVYGQVGDGSTTDRNTPSLQAGTAWLTADGGGFHSCGIRWGGTAWCWGRNNRAQLGDGTSTNRSAPVPVSGGATTYTTIDAGGSHTCATRSDSTLWCWGADTEGQMGDGANGGSTLVPTQVPGTGWRSVSAGYTHTCATKTDGTLWCWGDNHFGQVGDGTEENIRVAPAQVAGSTWESVSTAINHTCARRTDGTAWCWGDGHDGSLGQGGDAFDRSPVPLQVAGTWSAIEAGGRHTCGLKADHTAWCWGWNASGELGRGFESSDLEGFPTPAPIPGNDWASLTLGAGGTCGLKLDHTAWCWGANSLGGVGDGTNANRLTPTAVAGGGEWLEISAGMYHLVGVRWPETG